MQYRQHKSQKSLGRAFRWKSLAPGPLSCSGRRVDFSYIFGGGESAAAWNRAPISWRPGSGSPFIPEASLRHVRFLICSYKSPSGGWNQGGFHYGDVSGSMGWRFGGQRRAPIESGSVGLGTFHWTKFNLVALIKPSKFGTQDFGKKTRFGQLLRNICWCGANLWWSDVKDEHSCDHPKKYWFSP